jgi:hypothetical protein
MLWPGSGGQGWTLWAQAQSPLTSPVITPTVDPFATFTPTVGVTPTKVRRVVNEIVEPLPGDAIFGTTRIVGTALTQRFHRYDLHISPAGLENWSWLTSSYEVVHDDVLYLLDTTAFADGFYDLRVRALNDQGNYAETFVRGVEIRNANPPTLTPVPFATVTPMPVAATPTVDVSSRVPGGQGFYAPDNGTVLRGLVDLVATANGTPDNPFVRYELYLARAGTEGWTWITSSTRQTWQAPIYALDTTALADGLYDLRLRIVYRDSNYSEYFLRNLSVANAGRPVLAFTPPAGLSRPRSGGEVGGVVEFVGTVPAVDLLRWELAWSPGGAEQWRLLVSSAEPATDEVLARLDLNELPNGVYDFRLRVVREDSNYSEYFARGLRVRNR